MKKKLEKLLEKFKIVETKIVEILNEKPAYFDENDDNFLVKKSIKEYIKKINRAKKLFAEYEEIAKQIEDLNSDEGGSAEFSKAVLEFHESEIISDFDNIKTTEKEKTDGKTQKKVSTKNKKTKEAVKEF